MCINNVLQIYFVTDSDKIDQGFLETPNGLHFFFNLEYILRYTKHGSFSNFPPSHPPALIYPTFQKPIWI